MVSGQKGLELIHRLFGSDLTQNSSIINIAVLCDGDSNLKTQFETEYEKLVFANYEKDLIQKITDLLKDSVSG